MGNNSISLEGLIKGRYMNSTFVFFTLLFGILHQNPNLNSNQVTLISCGDKLEVLEKGTAMTKVKFQTYLGYVDNLFLTESKPHCFQEEYKEFFKSFDLSLSEISLWAKLEESYLKTNIEDKKN